MFESIAGDLIGKLLSGPFCCIIIFAPGLLIPVYRYLKSILREKKAG